MYALIDLIENKCLSTTQTKLDLLIAWCQRVERVKRYYLYQGHTMSFLQLNITGKDTYSALLPDGGYVVSPLNGIAYPTHSRTNSCAAIRSLIRTITLSTSAPGRRKLT